ncbi:MAG: thioesterase family protein [Anaerolineae bacterium]|nr:thioesterase family protein [Anaerolineae bacterium]
MTLKPGLVGESTHIVVEEDSAVTYGSGLAPVLSTPHLVALMENTAYEAVNPYLEAGQSTVGVHIDVQHLAPTPIGMEVCVRAELVEVDMPRLRFRVEAWDEVEKIGECEHERFVIDWERFLRRVERKQNEPGLRECKHPCKDQAPPG